MPGTRGNHRATAGARGSLPYSGPRCSRQTRPLIRSPPPPTPSQATGRKQRQSPGRGIWAAQGTCQPVLQAICPPALAPDDGLCPLNVHLPMPTGVWWGAQETMRLRERGEEGVKVGVITRLWPDSGFTKSPKPSRLRQVSGAHLHAPQFLPPTRWGWVCHRPRVTATPSRE